MELPTSHLAAALMSGSSTFNAPQTESHNIADNAADEKKEKSTEGQKAPPYEDKEELASGEDFSDEVWYRNLSKILF